LQMTTACSPMASAIRSYRDQTEASARTHILTAERLAEEAAGAAAEDAERDEGRKEAEDGLRSVQQRLKVDVRRAAEAQAGYERRCKEEIAGAHAFHREVARFGKTSREAERAKTKLEKARGALRAAEGAYRASAEEAEAARQLWEEKTEEAFDSAQSTEEKRTGLLLHSLWKVANVVSSACVAEDDGMESLRRALEDSIAEGYLDEFVRARATGERRPHSIWFEPKPTSTSIGLGPASPEAYALSRENSTLSLTGGSSVGAPQSRESPPKPPRLIHYAARSLDDWGKLSASYPSCGLRGQHRILQLARAHIATAANSPSTSAYYERLLHIRPRV